jgi:hypothetical protein
MILREKVGEEFQDVQIPAPVLDALTEHAKELAKNSTSKID